mgnify:CR=1 FL=1|jgi:uncharacterized protein YneF (UPF0154 family)
MEYLITVVVLVYGIIGGWFLYQINQQKNINRSK